MFIRITLVVEDVALRQGLRDVLARPDVLIQLPRQHKDLWERLSMNPSDVLIISQSFLPKPLKDKIKAFYDQPDSPAVVVLSDSGDPKVHAELMAAGCDAVLFAGLAVEQVRDVVEAMLEKHRRIAQKRFFSPQPLGEPKLADFASKSRGMTAFMNLVPRVVQSDTALLIQGETGVGKERLASAIHAEGPRSKGRFVALNCGALPESLLESELFGHVQGAFTGATAARRGWFEIAHRGTLFLDEVGEIPLHLQVKMLRVLQEHEVQPIGSEKSFGVDVRIIAASNRHLKEEVDAGRFRRDLFHRLSVVTVTVPPLRDRTEDIPDLVERHIHYIAQEVSRHVTGINAEAMQALSRYPWPGNIRELNNVIERAILLCDNSTITLDDLPYPIAGETTPRSDAQPQHLQLPDKWLAKPFSEVRKNFFADFERQYIEGVLIATQGRIGEAAKRAGMQERSLYEKMKRFGMNKEDFRQPQRKADSNNPTADGD